MKVKPYFDWGRAVRYDTLLRDATKLVALALHDRVGCKDLRTTCYPHIATIKSDTCLGKNAVHAAIAQLEKEGVCEVSRKRGRRNHYSLLPVEGWTHPPEVVPPGGTGTSKGAYPPEGTGVVPPTGTGVVPPGGTHNVSVNESLNESSLQTTPGEKARRWGPDAGIVDSIWKAYPKGAKPRKSKLEIWSAVLRITERPDIADMAAAGEWLLAAVQEWAGSAEVARRRDEAKAEGKAADHYIPACENWMLDGCYDEDRATWGGPAEDALPRHVLCDQLSMIRPEWNDQIDADMPALSAIGRTGLVTIEEVQAIARNAKTYEDALSLFKEAATCPSP